MKNIINTSIFFSLLIYSSVSQAQQLDRQVIASAGISNSATSYTIGEVMVNSSSLSVTVGFEQPEFMVKVLATVKDISRELQIYPVPTKDRLTIRGMDFEARTTQHKLYDMEGKQVSTGVELYQNEMELDLTLLPSGNYFLTLINETNRTQAHYKILKIK